MTRWSATPREQRSSLRVRAKGSIELRCGTLAIRGRIVDVAAGGVRFRATDARAIADFVGTRVVALLAFDHDALRVFSLRATVVRGSAATAMVAIELSRPPLAYTERVCDELVAATAHDAAPHVMIVDAASGERHSIADAFRHGGCGVTEVSTPAEAIAQLDRDRFDPGVMAIADTVPPQIAEELRAEVRRRLPDIHMVAIGRSSVNVHPASSWLSSCDARGDLAVRVGRVITAHTVRRHPQCQGDRTWWLGT